MSDVGSLFTAPAEPDEFDAHYLPLQRILRLDWTELLLHMSEDTPQLGDAVPVTTRGHSCGRDAIDSDTVGVERGGGGDKDRDMKCGDVGRFRAESPLQPAGHSAEPSLKVVHEALLTSIYAPNSVGQTTISPFIDK
jgi:hypothetical protein